ncbi:hypothetical protein [Ralstonia wenshanensis]|uniref:hypothetical protein n=1 Tax=Ralstonia wenshanensis TaxID=2842456 RepID=UPI003D996C58
MQISEFRDLLANDGFAATFQTMGQYRTELLRSFDGLRAQADAQPFMYQRRFRHYEGGEWSEWEDVDERKALACENNGVINGWIYEVRRLYLHPAEASAPGLSEETQRLIEAGADCIFEVMMLEQNFLDSPPSPESQWDSNADQLAHKLRMLLSRARAEQLIDALRALTHRGVLNQRASFEAIERARSNDVTRDADGLYINQFVQERWEDCASAATAAEPSDDPDVPEAIRLLGLMFDGYENGRNCYEDPEGMTGFIGPAFRIDEETFDQICKLLNRRNPPRYDVRKDGLVVQEPKEPTQKMLWAMRCQLNKPQFDNISNRELACAYKAARATIQEAAQQQAEPSAKCEECGDAVPKGACYCKEGCVHAIGHTTSQQAEPGADEQPAFELPDLPEPLEIDWPTLNAHALGCGVEDRGLYDRYDCANYGFEDGVDQAASRVPNQIFDADQMREYAYAAIAAWQARAAQSGQRAGVTDDMRSAVRFAPSSAHWSQKLIEFFGPDAREGINALERQLREALAGQRAGVAEGDETFQAVIAFVLRNGIDGIEFLRCWNEGDFEACRKEWPEAPDACYIGADPIAAPTQQQEGE